MRRVLPKENLDGTIPCKTFDHRTLTVDSLAELNERLTALYQRDQERTTRGKPGTVATLVTEDRAAMLSLPAKRFEPRRVAEVSVDSLSLVRFTASR